MHTKLILPVVFLSFVCGGMSVHAAGAGLPETVEISAGIYVSSSPDLGDAPDDIVGEYYVCHEGEESRVRFSKMDDGTYSAQVIWVRNRLDENGNVRLDEKNPDKSLRNVECDKIVLIEGLVYDVKKQRWSGGKIYDPIRGIRANATCYFSPEGVLNVKGSLMGFSETVHWKKEK